MISEFYCDECHKYNTVDLEKINGLHIIICGFCKHEHYRTIKNGKIGDCRFDKSVLEKVKLNAFTYFGKWRDQSWEKNQFLCHAWSNKLN